MADQTQISWTDHTFNPWWGCTKIAPGCDNCYAAALDKRTGGDYWAPKQAPRRTKLANWRKVMRWNEQAEIENRRHRVFCGSMMDWCDKDAPPGARYDLFSLIKMTPMLDWQLLTKRATLIERCLPADWGSGYDNVWLGVTCENMEHGYPRMKALQLVKAKVKFVSFEPLLEDLQFIAIYLRHIDWAIIGGESGPGYRVMEKGVANWLIRECKNTNVPIWFKQWGGNKRDKGGSLVDGKEIKQWPKVAQL